MADDKIETAIKGWEERHARAMDQARQWAEISAQCAGALVALRELLEPEQEGGPDEPREENGE